MTDWAKAYIQNTERIIQNYDLMSTDQQVLYIARNSGKLKISIQGYGGKKYWYYLGDLCLAEGEKKQKYVLKHL